jgi:hypothetical protein
VNLPFPSPFIFSLPLCPPLTWPGLHSCPPLLRRLFTVHWGMPWYLFVNTLHLNQSNALHSSFLSFPPSSVQQFSICFTVSRSCTGVMYLVNVHPVILSSFPLPQSPLAVPPFGTTFCICMSIYVSTWKCLYLYLSSTYERKYSVFVFLNLAYLT